jgi:dolichol-phosphate mannosyltransferase
MIQDSHQSALWQPTWQPAVSSILPLRVSIVVPTFNESENVRALLGRLDVTLGTTGWEVIFVDDDSPDGTSTVVREIACGDYRVRCLQRMGRRGLSSACIEGMLATSAPTIAVIDADLQHDETVLPIMLAEIEQAGADVVVGTRYSNGGSTGDWNGSRKAMSRIACIGPDERLFHVAPRSAG